MLRTHLRPRGSQRRESDCWGDPAAQTGNHAQPRVAAEARNITEYERGARKLAGPGVTRRQSGNRRGLNASPFLAIACGKLGLVGMSKTQIETFKPPSADDPVLSEIVRRLSEVYHPLRIYLFGSAARGDAGPDSDYDLMVILPDEAPQHLRRGNAGYRALRGTGVAADVQVWPQGDFNRQLHLKASFPSTIVREGKLLYGA
jgi:hypothetical protein